MSGRIISHPRIEQELPCQRLELDTTYGVDDDGSEDRGCDCRPVLGIFLAADELWMVTPEEDSEDRQNNDGKYRNGKASKASAAIHDPAVQRRGDVTHQDHACTALTMGFILSGRTRKT
jgi:hypothetical protein